jgi:hypothetical protein
MEIDYTHRNFIIPAKKRKKKATWCNGFILLPPSSEMDKVEGDRVERVIRFRHKLLKNK